MHGVRGRGDVLGIAAAALGKVARAQQHALADGNPGNQRAYGFDLSGDVVARIGRQRRHPFVDAAADQLVGLADAEGPGADQDLPLARRRHWRVGVVERLRPSGAMHQYRFHPNAPSPLVDFDLFSKISPIAKIIATGFF